MWKKLTEWFHEHHRRFTSEKIAVFIRHLREEEYSEETVKKYLRAVQYLADYAQGRPVTRELSAAWKAQLEEAG